MMRYFIVMIFALCRTAAAAVPDQQTAAALYEGRAGAQAGQVRIGDARLPAAGFACKGCHGRDGRGGGESAAPAIDGDALFAAAGDRPAYDAGTFAAALAEGRRADGGDLSAAMPRYVLAPAVVAGMAAYLAELPRRQRQGVSADTITFAVPTGSAATAFANAYAARLQARLSEMLQSGRVYARSVRVIVVEAASASIAQKVEPAALAVVAMPSPGFGSDVFVQRGIPVLLPLAPLRGDEDRTLVRGLAPSWQHIAGAFAAELKAQAVDSLAVIGDDAEHPLLRALPAAGWNGRWALQRGESVATLPVLPGSAIVLLPAGRTVSAATLIGRMPAGLPVFVTAAQAGAEVAPLLARRNLRVIVEAPALLNAALGNATDAIDTHASAAAAVLAEALRAAGPDPTRAGLVRAFDGLVLEAYGLDYRREPLTGTSAVRIVPEAMSR